MTNQEKSAIETALKFLESIPEVQMALVESSEDRALTLGREYVIYQLRKCLNTEN